MLSLLRCGKKIAFPIESCTFTPQNGGKIFPGCDVKLISVNCITQCVRLRI